MIKKWNPVRSCLFCIVILLFAAVNSAWTQTVSREAQKHMNRGKAAAEMANSPADYEEAIREFEKAVRLDPDWPAPYFNLGYVQKEAGKYQDALNSYQKYLDLLPNAPDAAQVQAEIDQIEYKLEKVLEAAKIRGGLAGEWAMTTMLSSTKSRWPITFIVNGDSIVTYLPTTRSMGYIDKFTDYDTIPVKLNGDKIQFNVELKEVYTEPGIYELLSTAKAEYTLDSITFDKMEGAQAFTAKSFNSDGSVWKDLKGTEKVHFNKGKHSDDPFINSLMR